MGAGLSSTRLVPDGERATRRRGLRVRDGPGPRPAEPTPAPAGRDGGAGADPARGRDPAGRLEISRVVGRLAAQLAVLNEEPTVGGGQSSTPLVVEADVARVRKLAADHARSDALSKLQGEVGPEESLVLQTLDFTTLEERLDHRPGDQVGSFNYRLRARVSGA